MIHPLNEVQALYVRVYYGYYSYYWYYTYCISGHGRTYIGITGSKHCMVSYMDSKSLYLRFAFLFALCFFVCV